MSGTGKNECLILVLCHDCDPKRSQSLFKMSFLKFISYLWHPVLVKSRELSNYPFSIQMRFLRLLEYISSSIFLNSIQRVPKKQQERKQRIADEILDHWNYSLHGACHSLQNTICLTHHPVPRRWKSQKISYSWLSSIQWYYHLLISPLRYLYLFFFQSPLLWLLRNWSILLAFLPNVYYSFQAILSGIFWDY